MTETDRGAGYAKTVSRAFELFQGVVNTDPDELKEARRRRDLFDGAFEDEPDVGEVFCSGSLRRKTHKDPIHDVDSVVVYKPGSRPGWGLPGPSAKAALAQTKADVERLLGADGGSAAQEVTGAEPRNHAVRCSFGELRGHGFTVDVMPALRVEGGLLVPVAREDRWEVVDPEYLIEKTAERQAAWDEYVPLVRVLKFWKDERKNANPALDAKSLLIEVLAFELLTRPEAKPEALETLFTRAALRIRREPAVSDPAGKCGPVQRDVNVEALHAELVRAAGLARSANLADAAGDHDRAIEHWRAVLGPSFPSPRRSPALLVPGAAGAAIPAQPQDEAAGRKRAFRDEPQG
jgi:hypothetical protein